MHPAVVHAAAPVAAPPAHAPPSEVRERARTATPTPPAVAERKEEALAAGSVGTTTARAPAWSGGALPPRADAGDDAPRWWVHLAWTLPVVGLGGVAAVLLTRQKRRSLDVPSRMRSGRMAPVSPNDLPGLLHNGHIAATRGAYAEAVSWFEHALRISPELHVAHFCKGICLAASGRAAEAYRALRTACAVEPADASYRIHFARVALALGRHKEAMDALELVARAMPELGPAMLEDAQLAALRDHPRFLMICGAL